MVHYVKNVEAEAQIPGPFKVDKRDKGTSVLGKATSLR
jgi:hypothetical protein